MNREKISMDQENRTNNGNFRARRYGAGDYGAGNVNPDNYEAEMDQYGFRNQYNAGFGNNGIGQLFSTGGSPWSALKSVFMESMSQGNMHVDQMQAEVNADQRASIGLLSQDGQLCHLLLNRLYNHVPIGDATMNESGSSNLSSPELHVEGCTFEGLFLLLTLPDPIAQHHQDTSSTRHDVYLDGISDYGSADWLESAPSNLTPQHVLSLLQEVDCITYLIRASTGWQASDARWCSRLRSGGKPIIPIVIDDGTPSTVEPMTIDGQASLRGRNSGYLRRLSDAIYLQAAVRPVVISRDSLLSIPDPYTLQPDLLNLLRRILELRPRLAVPLAQNIPGCRRQTVQRIIRSGVIMTSALGLEPIPLIDLPLHVALNWKVALQIGAIYGRPSLDLHSREMMGTVGLSLALRLLAQQSVKLLPIVGWLLSAAISGASTWLLGQALVRYYEEDLRLNPQGVKDFASHACHAAKEQLSRLPKMRKGNYQSQEIKVEG